MSPPLQVRYGAERVFSSEATNITEEDVDALIAKVGAHGKNSGEGKSKVAVASTQPGSLLATCCSVWISASSLLIPSTKPVLIVPRRVLTRALCLQGEAATKELNDKLQNFSNDAMRFTMDGGINGGCLAPAVFDPHLRGPSPFVVQPAIPCRAQKGFAVCCVQVLPQLEG